ncbi:hypothetical protein K239x_44750 [Planctomycetes bacterium K23_9]|uniref:N-acetyltransferase domain-containing protein n=2 Tax=Stieleria marina TaxID=1930275 RepID=A0A517NZB8_9BACT|nr:hypothetical protein K239x_44750 [Planctomycetes bacterium K23_9]
MWHHDENAHSFKLMNLVVEIRQFRNGDLPALADVWVQHWSALGPPPPVSTAIIEQSVLSRTFFDAQHLLVAVHDDHVQGWCHFAPDVYQPSTAILSAICFTAEGLESCDQLLSTAETLIAESGFDRIVVGPLRDEISGYAGLAPLGHGIGVSVNDTRVSSLLSRQSYTGGQNVVRMTANTNPFRMPVDRQWMQLQRSTRMQVEQWIPADPRHASAMAHLDVEHHELVDHRSDEVLASLSIWLSDPDAQVMNCSQAILDLGQIHHRAKLESAESFLIGSVIQLLANRRVFTIETAVDQDCSELIEQLAKLNFQSSERGQRWGKLLA